MSRLGNPLTTSSNSNFRFFSSIDINVKNITVTEVNSATAVTYSVSDLIEGGVRRTGSGNVTDLMPNAADIISEMINRTSYTSATLPFLISFDFIVCNDGSNTITIGNGIGVTTYGKNSLSPGAAVSCRCEYIGTNLCYVYVLGGFN
jgi:archaellin